MWKVNTLCQTRLAFFRVLSVVLFAQMPLFLFHGTPPAMKYSMFALWTVVALFPLLRWLFFICPHCRQSFFFPLMKRSRFFVPRVFAKQCANCHVALEA